MLNLNCENAVFFNQNPNNFKTHKITVARPVNNTNVKIEATNGNTASDVIKNEATEGQIKSEYVKSETRSDNNDDGSSNANLKKETDEVKTRSDDNDGGDHNNGSFRKEDKQESTTTSFPTERKAFAVYTQKRTNFDKSIYNSKKCPTILKN
uniref:Uncharacterized protein n=1 Tax=Strongyloides papillosus TaxID=174720 RepID=A0A0N5BI85_STREA